MPERPPLTPEVARSLIAAVARLARAALGLHTVVLSPPRSTPQADLMPDAVRRLDDLSASIANVMATLASALRHLQQPDPIPALRPIHTALRVVTAPSDLAVVAVSDHPVGAIDTLDGILRTNLTPVQRP